MAGEITFVPLSDGRFAMIDEEDFDRVMKHSWSFSSAGKGCKGKGRYPASRIGGRKKYGGALISLHRFVMNAEKGKNIDHIDGNPLNNCKRNLRYATMSQNQMNRIKSRGPKSHSRFKGVSYTPGNRAKKWFARIKINGKQRHLGYFATQVGAAVAYNNAAGKLFGEFARLNLVEAK